MKMLFFSADKAESNTLARNSLRRESPASWGTVPVNAAHHLKWSYG